MFQFSGSKLHFSSKNKKIIDKYLFWTDMKKKNQGQKVDAPTLMEHSLSKRPVQYYSFGLCNGGNQEETWVVNILSTLFLTIGRKVRVDCVVPQVA
jgi:hypothetical protein